MSLRFQLPERATFTERSLGKSVDTTAGFTSRFMAIAACPAGVCVQRCKAAAQGLRAKVDGVQPRF